jgi:hypothetical protein
VWFQRPWLFSRSHLTRAESPWFNTIFMTFVSFTCILLGWTSHRKRTIDGYQPGFGRNSWTSDQKLCIRQIPRKEQCIQWHSYDFWWPVRVITMAPIREIMNSKWNMSFIELNFPSILPPLELRWQGRSYRSPHPELRHFSCIILCGKTEGTVWFGILQCTDVSAWGCGLDSSGSG